MKDFEPGEWACDSCGFLQDGSDQRNYCGICPECGEELSRGLEIVLDRDTKRSW